MLGTVTLAAGLYLVACGGPEADDEGAPGAEAEQEAEGNSRVHDGIITVEPEIMGRLGLQTAALTAGTLAPSADGFGRVLDAAPLLTLWGGLDAAEAEVSAGQQEVDRMEVIVKSEQGVARKTLEAARAVLRQSQIKAANLHRDVTVQWGTRFADLLQPERNRFADALAAGSIVFVRADLPIGAVSAEPVSATVIPLDGAGATLAKTDDLWPAPASDDRLQGRSYVLKITDNSSLHPGARPRVRFAFPGDPQAGVVVPEQAVVHTDGHSWVFLKSGEHTYKLILIRLAEPLGEGWFEPAEGGLKPGDEVIVEGTGALLALELGAEEID